MKLAGHAVHPMLVVFPLGLLATAVVFDLVGIGSDRGSWHAMAFWMIAAGLIGGVLAAVTGFLDYRGIPRNTRARSVGLRHGGVNAVVLALFLVSWIVRRPDPAHPATIALMLSFVGAALAMVGGWLGGELVERLGMGVDEGAHPNAPSSLSGRPAASNDQSRPRRAA